ncbi:hypothetical protein [Methylobacterium radiotolerans]|uniref:hypothetical protein n=1 Tax=Methylobacterium radiotolerans TaxID=31998 RepID=UPI0038D12990
METQSSRRESIAMLTEEEVLPVVRLNWPNPMTANEIFFAVRPELQGAEPPISGSAYTRHAINALVAKGDLCAAGKSGRSDLFRVKNKPLTDGGHAGLDVRDVSHAPIAAPVRSTPLPPQAASPKPEPAAGRDDPDPIATILLGMARAPKPGSRIDIVKVQALEGIAWARAAGWSDLRIAQEIIEASGLDARPDDIRKLVSSVPGGPVRPAATAQPG